MSNNVTKSRIQMKADTADNWYTAGLNGFTPLKNEAIFYTDENNIKLGNGTTNINDLNFFFSSGIDEGTARNIAREEAQKFSVNAMEFMGVVSALPTGLDASHKGYFYKVGHDFDSNNRSISLDLTDTTDVSGEQGDIIDFTHTYYFNNLNIQQYGYDLTDYTQFSITPLISCEYNVSNIRIVGSIGWFDDNSYEYSYEQLDVNTVDFYTLPQLGYDDAVYIDSIEVTISDSVRVYDDESSSAWVNTTISCGLRGITIGSVAPADISTIHRNDIIIWDGSIWNVIPSGDDPYRPIKVNNVSIGNSDLNLKSGDNITLTRSGGNVTIKANFNTDSLKNEIIQEMEDYVDNAILNGAW